MTLKFPNIFTPGTLAHALADLDSVAPTGPGYGLFGAQPQYAQPAPVDPRGRYLGPRVGIADRMRSDHELLIAAAMAEKAAGVTLH